MKVSKGLAVFLLSGLFSCTPVGIEKRVTLKATFFDVGQGDAALVQFPGGATLLVDAGPERGGLDTLLSNRSIKAIDQVALSHPQADHYGGLFDIARKVKIGRLRLPPLSISPVPGHYGTLIRLLVDTLGVDTVATLRGDTLVNDGASLALCLWPDTAAMTFDQGDSVNARSMVLHVRLGQGDILFTGDMNFDTERALLNLGSLPPVELLKVPHHGSKTSSSPAFLNAVRPRLSVISCGKGNPYGHPTSDALERLQNSGAVILRTDLAGTVEGWMDEDGILIF